MRLLSQEEMKPPPTIPEAAQKMITAEVLASMPMEDLETVLDTWKSEDFSPVISWALHFVPRTKEHRSRRVLLMRWIRENVYTEAFRRWQ